MQTLNKQRTVALGTLGVLSASLVGGAFMATPAQADASAWKKVAIGAGAVGAYGLVRHNGKLATIGGLAAAGSYLKYRHDKKKETRTSSWYHRRYGRTAYRHYR